MEENYLKKLQNSEHEILKNVVKVCEENNLNYFLIGGTLLGAVRHKGFIPWDDDLDIAMPREDYNKFLSVSSNSLDDHLWVHSHLTDSEYWLPFAKVKIKNTVFEESSSQQILADKGIFMDVFPLDNGNKSKSLFQTIQALFVNKLSTIILWKRGYFEHNPNKLLFILLTLLKPIPLSFISKTQQNIMSLNKNSKSEYFVNLGSNYNHLKQTIEKAKYFPPIELEFEGFQYKAPNDSIFILKRLYGNYKKLPPVDKRISHKPIRIKFEDGEEINFKN